MTEIRTSWSKKAPYYGAFDDFVIIESSGSNDRFIIRPEEFDYMASQLLINWKAKKSEYIQLLREWNECIGFNGIAENPSTIMDKKDTIDAIKLIEGVTEPEFAKMTSDDLLLLVNFLVNNKEQKIIIRKE